MLLLLAALIAKKKKERLTSGKGKGKKKEKRRNLARFREVKAINMFFSLKEIRELVYEEGLFDGESIKLQLKEVRGASTCARRLLAIVCCRCVGQGGIEFLQDLLEDVTGEPPSKQ